MQFVVCDNGISGTICEHSVIDGVTISPLNTFVTNAILSLAPEPPAQWLSDAANDAVPIEPMSLDLTNAIDTHITDVRREFNTRCALYSYVSFEISSLCASFLRDRKVPQRSSVQMALQLAVRRFHGYSPSTSETVSMAHFRKGRVDVNHILWPEVAEFCAAAAGSTFEEVRAATCSFVPKSGTDDILPLPFKQHLLPLLNRAIKAHARSLARASAGRAINRHLKALEWMLWGDEPGGRPRLFDDPVFARIKPSIFMSDSLESGALECGLVYPIRGTIWCHHEIKDDR